MPNEEDILRSINSSQVGQGGEYNKPDVEDSTNKAREVWVFIWETVKIIIISLAIIVPIRYYLVQPFFVKGASMETNFHDGDYLLIDEISYRFNEPNRGDVVVFRYPKDPSEFFIKRIVALPNETIEIKDDKVTVYNSDFPKGLVLKEDYLSSSQKTIGNHFVKLGEDEFYVLGDNRLQSSDSRSWGVLGDNFITGRVFIRLWPFSNLKKIDAVNY